MSFLFCYFCQYNFIFFIFRLSFSCHYGLFLVYFFLIYNIFRPNSAIAFHYFFHVYCKLCTIQGNSLHKICLKEYDDVPCQRTSLFFLNYLWIEFSGVLFTASIRHILTNLTHSLVLLQSKRYNNTLSKFRFNLISPWVSCMKTKHHFSFSFVQSHASSYKPSGPTHFFLFHLNQATKKKH